MIALNYMDVSKNGQGGVIVNIASILGLINSQLSPLYCATKHAVVSFVRSMKVLYCPKDSKQLFVKFFNISGTQ